MRKKGGWGGREGIEQGVLVRECGVKTEMTRRKETKSFEGQMRMTAYSGSGGERERGRKEGKKKSTFLTEATWQHHTAIFHSHSSAFAHDFKGTQAPRKPSSKHGLPIFQTCHSLSVYQLVPHKGPPPSAVAIVVVIVPMRGKHVRRPCPFKHTPFRPHPHNASLSEHTVIVGGTASVFFLSFFLSF